MPLYSFNITNDTRNRNTVSRDVPVGRRRYDAPGVTGVLSYAAGAVTFPNRRILSHRTRGGPKPPDMHHIVTDIEIEADPVRIWSILMDFPSYPEWNPFIRSIAGTPSPGSRLEVSVQPPAGRAMSFQPVVLACVDNRELRWRGRLPVPGLFDGEHYFRVESLAPGRARFVHGERFSGALIPFLRKRIDGPIRAGFIEMNQAVKSRAEHE